MSLGEVSGKTMAILYLDAAAPKPDFQGVLS
jgi:hypothetical protein